jgi:tRNA U34 5-methylaminomethyl-2-thiouridine-forming methyltransferase MnmC
MTSPIRIIATEDGSQSLYNEALNETYHSTHGALTESQYVFIKQGLDLLVERGETKIDIFEVGFGTGLNALLVQEYAKGNPQLALSFTTLEPFPLSASLISELTYDQLIAGVSREDFEALHDCAWEEQVNLSPNFSLIKHRIPLKDFASNLGFDLVFFDAFAPSKQPEMWEMALLSKVSALMNTGAVFVTYCARGQLKRDLADLGLRVETLPGPPGKKEMVRGVKTANEKP